MSRERPIDVTGTLLLIGITLALITIIADLVARVVPDWRPITLVIACGLVTLEAALVRYRMIQGRHLHTGAVAYLAAELFALLVVMRVAATMGWRTLDVDALAAQWIRAPLSALDTVLLGYLVAGLGCALAVRLGLSALDRLEPPTQHGKASYALDEAVARAEAEADERGVARGFSRALTWGGVVALLAVTGQLVSLGPLQGRAPGLTPASTWAGAIYLGCAVLLHSKAHLGMLHTAWRRDQVQVEARVVQRWPWLGGGLIIALISIGAWLPLGAQPALEAGARSGAGFILNGLALVIIAMGLVSLGMLGLLIAIPALLLGLLANWSGLDGSATEPAMEPPPPPPAAPPEVIPPVLPGLIFWVCMACLAGYALWLVLRRQTWAVVAAQRLRHATADRIGAWLQRVWQRLIGYAELVQSRLSAPPATSAPDLPHTPPVRRRLIGLTPSERVQAMYGTVLEQAERVNLPRKPAETPNEHGLRLHSVIPDEHDNLETVTEAYLAARYSQHAPTPPDVRALRRPWARLMRALRRVVRK